MQSKVDELYKETYLNELKDMTDQQVVTLLILNTRNHAKGGKRYGLSKRQTDHLSKVSMHIDWVKDEILKRLEENYEPKNDFLKELGELFEEHEGHEIEVNWQKGVSALEDDEGFNKMQQNGTHTITIKVKGGALDD